MLSARGLGVFELMGRMRARIGSGLVRALLSGWLSGGLGLREGGYGVGGKPFCR